MTTNYEAYQHAVEQLAIAVAALDQAKASMKNAGMAHWGVWNDIRRLVATSGYLIETLKHADCEECGHALSMHGGKYGCDYEYCACKWGQQEAKH